MRSTMPKKLRFIYWYVRFFYIKKLFCVFFYDQLEGSESAVDRGLLRILLEAGADPFYSRFGDHACQLECPLHLLLNNSDSLLQNLNHFREICPENNTRMVRKLLLHAVSRYKASTLDVSCLR